MASTLHLAVAATLAVHLIAAVVVDAVGVVNQDGPRPRPTRISVVDLDTGKLTPRPPPEPAKVPDRPQLVPTVAEPIAKPQPTDRRRTTSQPITQPQPAIIEPPHTTETATPSSGGGRPTFVLPDNGSDGRGPEVGRGRREISPTGDGGAGGGSGGGAGGGSGSGDGPPKVVSLAAIKTQAKPKGNYDYFDAGKSYPPAARQLGVEGIVKAKLVVDENGKVTKVTLLRKLGHGLDELALARGRALEFDPALDADGRAVASIVVWEFTFTLPK